MPTVSIIIPVYNAELYLSKCLNSIQAQTYNEWECICIDDGSTDGSKEILCNFANLDSRFYCISQENQGPSIARNCGLELAKGKYVAFIDSDDYIAPEYLEKLLSKAESENADVCCCGYTCLEPSQVYRHHDYPPLDSAGKNYFLKHLFTATGGTAWGKLYKLDVIQKHKIRFNDHVRMCEDQLFALDFYAQSERFSSIAAHSYFYCRQNVNSLSLNTSIETWRQQAELIDYIESVLNDLGVSRRVKQYCLQKKTSSVLSALFSKSVSLSNREIEILLVDPLIKALIRNIRLANLSTIRFMAPLKLGWIPLIRLIYK